MLDDFIYNTYNLNFKKNGSGGPDRTDRIISVQFRFGSYANFGPVLSRKFQKLGLRSFRFGPVLDRTDRMLSPS